MSGILTGARVPGVLGSGWSEWGRLTRAEIISAARRHFQHQLEVAQAVLATPDDQFSCQIYRGTAAQRTIKELPPEASE